MVNAGDTAEFELQTTSTGVTAGTQNLTITDTLPAGVTFNSCLSGCGSTQNGTVDTSFSVNGQVLTINIKGVTSGQPLPTIRYRVSIDADAAAGTYQNTATLTSDNAQVVADSSAAALTSDASVRVISQGGYTVQNTSNGTEFAVNQPFTFN